MSASEDRTNGGPLAEAISNAVVGIMRDHTGRGPTRTRTTIVDDLVLVFVRDALTKAEQKLVDGGEAPAVLEWRHRFQIAMEDELVAAVERLTDRKVLAFLSANHVDPDMAMEAFVLEPCEQ
jgi:uncharacterized protein YbcI